MATQGASDAVRWDGRKWPSPTHWQFSMRPLGSDEHGDWYHVPAGTPARRGRDHHIIAIGFVLLVPRLRWWAVEFYENHPLWELYVNIGTPCERRPGAVRQVDLDLDVVRAIDGKVQVLDEDEFADHQVRFGYPPELIEGARRATDEVVALLEQQVEPFDVASLTWLELAGRP